MSRIFSDDFKELVRSRTDIVSLIGESVALRSRGREFVGLCPFHDDHNPSMCVYPDRQSYRCWSCNEGGDCFSFVMKHDRVEFRDALEMLASRANLPLPKAYRTQPEGTAENKNRLYEVLAWAENEFHNCLLNEPIAERARRYLAERRFSPETITKFRLGYHPNAWEWLQERGRNRFSAEQLFAVRLVGQRDGGNGYFDQFVDRVLFPIRDGRGRPVAFGGRILPDTTVKSDSKYWNSPESPVFSKSRILYGLDAAREAITKSDTAVLMEGYVDCIMSHQFGVANVVGTLGTALNELHVSNVKRFARRVVLALDGDEAGRKAAEKSLPKFLAQEVDLRILTLPGDLDPADFLLESGGDAFRTLLNQAVEAWEHKFRTVTERFGLESIDARHRVLEEMLEVVSQVPEQPRSGLSGSWQERQNIILGKLAQRLSVSEQSVRQRLHDLRSKKASTAAQANESRPVRIDGAATATSAPVEVFPQTPTRDDLAERELLEIILTSPESIDAIRSEMRLGEIKNAFLRELLDFCCQLTDRGIAPSYERVTAALEDQNLKRLAALISDHARERGVHGALLTETLTYFRERREIAALASAQRALAGTPETPSGLDDDVKKRLRLATELHQRRNIKKTLT